ncbi:hypothetical protein ABH14_22535 [Brevibacillus brevis]|nr:hypothetical protein [Brevibacillus brevis]
MDAKSLFLFFSLRLGRCAKDLRLFLLFPLRAFQIKTGFKSLKRLMKCKQLRQRRIFPDVATCGVLPSGEGFAGKISKISH